MRQVAHALLTRPPLSQIPRHSEEIQSKCFARLACVKHADSVHPEPGSNSRKKVLSRSGKLLAFLSRYLLLASDLCFRSAWFPFWIFLLEIFRVVVYCSVIKVLCFVVFRISATTSISYHVASRLSTTFFNFFLLPFRKFSANTSKPALPRRYHAGLIRQKIHPLAWWIFIISS